MEDTDSKFKAKLAKTKKRLKQITSSKKFLKLEKGQKTTGRILWDIENTDSWFFECGMHYGFKIGGQPRVLHCLNTPPKNQDDCPVCEFITALEGLRDSLSGEDREEVEGLLNGKHKIKIAHTNYINWAPVDKEGKALRVVKVFKLSAKHLQSIQEAMEDPDFGNITDVKNGHNITIARLDEGVGQYEIRRISPKPSNIMFNTWKKKIHDLSKIPEFFPRIEMIAHIRANYGELVEQVEDKLNWPTASRKKKVIKKRRIREEDDDAEE